MKHEAFSETREAVLALARQRGYRLSSTQLARWHRAGLIPRPHQQPRPEGRETCSLYPRCTGEQVLFLCSLRTIERRFICLAWLMCLAGYLVDLALIRDHLAQATQRLAWWCQWFADFQ